MNEEVVNLGHEVVDATVLVGSNPRQKVVHGLFQRVAEPSQEDIDELEGVVVGNDGEPRFTMEVIDDAGAKPHEE